MMQYLKRLLKIWNKRRWLKLVGKELDLYHDLLRRTNRQKYITNAMLDAYKIEFNEDLGRIE